MKPWKIPGTYKKQQPSLIKGNQIFGIW